MANTYDARMVEKPLQRDAERTRREILDIATREFADQGFAGARVDEIAAQTRTTKRMLYYYFGSKERLFVAVLERAYAYDPRGRADDRGRPPRPRRRDPPAGRADLRPPRVAPRLHPPRQHREHHRAEHVAGHRDLAGQNTPAIELIKKILERGRGDGNFTRDIDP